MVKAARNEISGNGLSKLVLKSKGVLDDLSPSVVRDTSKCILCRRCITVCNEIQGVGVLNAQQRGFKTMIGPAAALHLNSVNCAFCGQCTVVCPVGALQEKDAITQVWNALHDTKKRVIVQIAPAIRAALGEEFGYEPGTLVTGKMVTALREMGFDDVFDTNFTADLTIMEEGNEFLPWLSHVPPFRALYRLRKRSLLAFLKWGALKCRMPCR